MRSVTSLEFLANTHMLATLAATVGYAPSAGPAPAPGPESDGSLRYAALQGQSGSASSGTGGSEGSTDVAGPWNPQQDGRGALMPDARQFAPAGPSFDPGSSPD
jgi:hypothetical protein